MRGRDCYSWFWVFRIGVLSVEEGKSKLLSMKRRIATFLVSESLAVRVSRGVLEPRLLV
ncbi:hypothetical protein LINPERHAP1_LOCUS9019, partial [Linum perenne]